MISLHLASSSARRVDILNALGIPFTAAGVDIDETPLVGEDVQTMALRLAEAKARVAAAGREGAVLGADTAVALKSRIFGKPRSEAHALEMLSALSNRTHEVLTAVALICGDRLLTDVSVTQVSFRQISTAEARDYWRSGEPKGKAGAYAIQGAGGVFVEKISGSYSGVVGLPVFETARLFERAGLPFKRPSGEDGI